MIKFKILEENKEDVMKTKIEKSGLTTSFIIEDVIDHLVHTKKRLRESIAQLEIEDKQNEIVEDLLPMLKDIADEKMELVMLYAARKVQRQSIVDLKEACESTIKSYEDQVEQINKQLGLDIELPIESPYQKHEEDKETGDSGVESTSDIKE